VVPNKIYLRHYVLWVPNKSKKKEVVIKKSLTLTEVVNGIISKL
jgi:hypothetical protein